MKKLIVLTAAIGLSVVCKAAAVGWTMMGATDYAGGSYDVFLIGQNGVTGTGQIAALVAAGTSVDSYAFYSGGTVAANGSALLAATASGKTLTYDENGSAADNTYQAFIVVWDADGKNASYTALASTTLSNNTTSKTFGFANQSSNLSANNFSVAPEPTSGVLMLLGLAGLALKRKRA